MNSPHLALLLAQAKRDDLRRAAEAHNRHRDPSQTPPRITAHGRITLRTGSPCDEGTLGRLAALDGARPPTQPTLLAEVDGQLRAALSLCDGSVVAHPFHHTTGLIELLRARARQLEGPGQTRRRWRVRRWREGFSR